MVCNVMMKIYINNDDIEHEISKIYENIAKVAQVRSMEKLVEVGEKKNSYF